MSTVVDPDTKDEDVVVIDDEPTVVEPETLTCPTCSAPADAGQLMCLECGSRLALDYQRPPTWRLPAAIIGIVLLIAGIGVAIALAAVTNDADRTAAAPTQPTAAPASAPADTPPTTSSATPAPTTPTSPTPAPTGGATPTDTAATATPAPAPDAAAAGWPPGKSGFTVILASMPAKAAAEEKLKAAQAAGITTAALLNSDDFPTLKPGYWVVFDGQYDTIEQATTQSEADRGKGEFSDAYPRFVSKDQNAKP